MSWQATKALVERSGAKGNPSCFLVLVVLAEHANKYGVAWPGIPLLADRCEMKPRNVIRLLADANELGELHRRRYGPLKTIYHLTPGGIPVGPCDDRCEPPERRRVPQGAAPDGAPSGTDGEVHSSALLAARNGATGGRNDVHSSAERSALPRAGPLVQPPEPPEPPSITPTTTIQVVDTTGEPAAEEVLWDANYDEGGELISPADYEELEVLQDLRERISY